MQEHISGTLVSLEIIDTYDATGVLMHISLQGDQVVKRYIPFLCSREDAELLQGAMGCYLLMKGYMAYDEQNACVSAEDIFVLPEIGTGGLHAVLCSSQFQPDRAGDSRGQR